MPSTTNNLVLSIEVDSGGAIQSVQAVNQAFTNMGSNAANAGNNAANAFDKITVKMAGAIAAGNLFAISLEKIGGWMKQAIVDSALYAAKVDQLQMGLVAVVKANEGSISVANAQVAAIKAMGVTTEDATLAVTKLTAAGADYTKTATFMKVALQLVHDFGLSTKDAIDGLTRSVTTGYERTLRQYGLNVDFAKSYQELAAQTHRTVDQLGDMEKQQARVNAIVQLGTHLNDDFATKQGDAAEAVRQLHTDLTNLKQTLGEQLQGELKNVVGFLDELVKLASGHAAEIGILATAVKDLALALGMLAAVATAGKVAGLLSRLTAFALVNPWTAAIVGTITLISSLNDLLGVYDKVERKLNGTDSRYVTGTWVPGKPFQPFGPKPLVGGDVGHIANFLMNKDTAASAADAESKRIAAAQKKADDEQRAAEAAIAATKKLAADRLQVEKEAAKILQDSIFKWAQTTERTVSEVAEKLVAARDAGTLTAKSRGAFNLALRNDIGSLQRLSMGKYLQEQLSPNRESDAARDKAFNEQNNFASESLKLANDTVLKQYDFEEEKLAEFRDLQLRSLDDLNAQTVKQKLAVEQQKYQIEVTYLEKSKDLQLSRLRGQRDMQRAEVQGRADELISLGADPGTVHAALQGQISGINQQYSVAAAGVQGQTTTQEQIAADDATKAQTKVIQDKYKSVYDSILQASDKFFDALTDKSKSVWRSIADDLKNTFTNALKHVISSQIAGAFAKMITGIGPNGETGKAGGLIMGGAGGFASAGMGLAAAIAGAPGGTPTFLGGGGFSGSSLGSVGTAAIGSIPGMNLAAMSGGGGGFRGGVSADAASAAFGGGVLPGGAMLAHATGMPMAFPAAGGGGGGALGGVGGLSGIVKMLGGASGFGLLKTAGGWINGSGLLNPLAMMVGSGLLLSGATNPALAGTAAGTSKTILGGALTGYGIANKVAPGFGPMGALAGAGGGMVINGAERGGVGGVLEATGGGALGGAEIGAMIGLMGGPIGAGLGAAIGTGVGLISGLIGSLFGNALSHVKDVVKKAYGVKLDDGTAQAILQIAKQQFGGSISLAVSSSQVRNLVSLYAEATGQRVGNIAPKMVSYTAADSGGSLYNLPSTNDGVMAASYGGSVQTLGVGQLPNMGIASGGNLNIQLSGPATAQLLQGQVVQYAPSAVQNASSSSMSGNALAARSFAPGLVTR